jgi:hypothetical protein
MKKYYYLVPLMTIILGFCSFVLLSIAYDVFWITTPYNVPLIFNTSVMIGDSILLPIINYQIVKLVFLDQRNNVYTRYRRGIKTCIIIGLFLSIGLNYFSHLTWLKDQYTDFISINTSTMLQCFYLVGGILFSVY